MRKQLKRIGTKEVAFTCFFDRYGVRTINNEKKRKTLVVKNIYVSLENKIIFVDHLWLRSNKRTEKAGKLFSGDALCFNAVVKKYIKSGGTIELGVKNIKDFKKIF